MNWRPNFESMDELGKFIYVLSRLRLAFSVSVENKMENSHGKGWSNFKLNIDDLDIPLPKVLRISE